MLPHAEREENTWAPFSEDSGFEIVQLAHLGIALLQRLPLRLLQLCQLSLLLRLHARAMSCGLSGPSYASVDCLLTRHVTWCLCFELCCCRGRCRQRPLLVGLVSAECDRDASLTQGVCNNLRVSSALCEAQSLWFQNREA